MDPVEGKSTDQQTAQKPTGGAGPQEGNGQDWQAKFQELESRHQGLQSEHNLVLDKFRNYDQQAQAYIRSQSARLSELENSQQSPVKEDEFAGLDEDVAPLAKAVRDLTARMDTITGDLSTFRQGQEKKEYQQEYRSRQERVESIATKINSELANGAPLVSPQEVLALMESNPYADPERVAREIAQPRLEGLEKAGFERTRVVQPQTMGVPHGSAKPVWQPEEGPGSLEDLREQMYQHVNEFGKAVGGNESGGSQ